MAMMVYCWQGTYRRRREDSKYRWNHCSCTARVTDWYLFTRYFVDIRVSFRRKSKKDDKEAKVKDDAKAVEPKKPAAKEEKKVCYNLEEHFW